MDAKLKNRMEGLLLAERERATDMLRQAQADEAEAQSVSAGDVRRTPLTPGDAASDVQEEETDFITAARASRHLAEVDDALRAFAEDPDSLAVCSRCNWAIERARLELVPWTRTCALCARADGKGSPRLFFA